MRLVRLSDLTEDERKKTLEEQQERINKNKQESQKIQSEANQNFNDYVSQHGSYDTNKHTTTIDDLRKAYKNTPSYNNIKTSTNDLYRNSIWNDVKNTFSNLMLGGKQGAMQMLKGAETQLESNKNYKMNNERQFYNSSNVSDIAKAEAKSENSNDILNSMIKKKINNNLTKKSDYGIGNIDLNNRPVYKNEDGSISTVRSMSFWDDNENKEILVPTIAFDEKGNAISLTNDEAIQRYYQTGEYLGKFDDYKEADKYAEKLHENQEKIYTNNNENTIMDKNVPLKLDDENIKKELKKYKNSISNSKIDTNLTRNFLQNDIDKTSEEMQENTNNINNKVLRKANEQIVPALGQMGTGMVASAINPALGALYFTESATGGYYDDAKQRGMDDNEARKYSAIMGAMEGMTEQIGIENLSKAGKGVKALVKGTGKEVVKEGTKELTKSSMKTVLKNYGIGIADNIIQEAIIDPIQELTAQTVAGKDKAQWEGIGQKMLQDGINGGLVSAILGGANLGIQSCTGVVEKLHSNQKITGQEIQNAVKEAGQQLDTSKMMLDSVEQQVNKYKDYYTGKELDSNTQNMLNKAQSIIDNNYNIQPNTPQNQFETQEQQVIPIQDKNTSKSNIIERNNTKNTIIKDFNESAKQYNIDYKNEDLKEIKQMFDKRGINAYFDENTFQNNNDAFSVWKPTYDEQGNISGREVVFNPKAQDTNTRVQELAIHELGHDLDLNEVQNMILKDASRKENWESARKSLENTYKQAYKNDNIQISDENFNKIVDEEATMSILQRELGSQEYVNRLVNQNQSIAKKIYNWVIDKLNKFTVGKNEKIFWEDIKNKFETAYNQEFNKNDSNIYKKYSIQTDNNGNKYVKVDTDQNIFDGIDKKDYNKIAKMYIQDYLMGKTKLSDNDTAVIDRKSANKYTNPGKKQQNFDKKMQLTPELKNVLEIAQKDSISLPIKSNSKYQNWEYYKFDFELSGKKFNGTVNIGIDSNGNKHFYEINKIKEVDDISGTSLNRSSTSLSNNSLPSTQKNVNSQPLQKYSMQESENNSGSFSAQDNKGRNLSKEQQEYFKNSKVRNENGKLLTVYHGSNSEFTIFDTKKSGQASKESKVGFWFTETKEGAENFANSLWYGDKKARAYETYLNIKNPKIYDTVDNSVELKNIDNKIEELKTVLRKLENKNIAIEINKNELKWANESELEDIAKYEGIDYKDAKQYHDVLKEYNQLEKEYDNKKYNDSYEKFRSDIYAVAGKSASDANFGGTGMWLENENEIISKFKQQLIDEGYDGIIIKGTKYDSETMGKNNNQYVAFYPEQIKKVNNLNPTDNPDIRFFQNNETWQQFLEDNYQKQGTGKNLKEYNLPTKEDVKTKLNLPIKENINKQDNQTTQGEKIDWNEIERPEGKIRKHYRSIIESSNTTKEAKAIAKELMGTDTYVPETNKGQLAQADYRINNSSPEAELKSLMNRVIQGEKISSVDIAVGERLIQYYSKIGDKTNLQEAIQTTAMAGTSAGQTVQALAMLNHQTPEGQATWIQRSVDKMNNELAKRKGGTITKDEEGNIKVVNKKGQDITDKVDLFELTPDMIDKIVSSKNKTEMYDNIDQVYEDLGQQVPLSTMEKIDSWRYFSMLANPKTHIRNMVGNVAMGKTQSLKDKLAGGIEDIVGTFNKDMERTKTLRPADAKTKEFAKNDVLNPDVQSMMELNENKYNPQSRLQNARKTFKNDALENTLGRLFNWNDKLLEAEDALGLKSAYKKALTDYLTANKIDVDNITDKQLSKARNYAVEQAKEATFHQANSLATWINQASTNNKIVKGAKDAILPFVKTPLNVAKTGIEYNPVGLLKTITYDTVKLRKGDITVNKYIDNLSKGLTGTGIAVLGYALADAGILKASGGDDDKKEKYDEALGKQTYSITIGERTYSLDWLSPVGIPLFVGAEANALRNSQQKEKNRISSDDDKKYNQTLKSLENLANAMSNSMSPMSEMSMISGLTSALSSYEKDKTSAVITNAVKSYVNQFVPTVLGQIARTTDDYERSTTSTKSSGLSKAIDQTKLQLMSKIPGLRQKLPTKEDIWGNEQKAEPNIPLRVVNNFVNPSTVKNINTSKVDEELDNLYNKTGESTILPSTIEKTYTINGQTYRMTNEEYSKYKKNYGQTSYKLLDDLINSNDYNKLSDEQKQKAIENIYSYAKEVNKVDYAKNNNETVKTSTLYDTLEELKQKGGNQSSYLNYIAKTKDITGEDSSKKKIEVLANSNYTDKTKEIIYKNTEGSKDKKIIVVDKLGLPINEYLKYKSQKFESDKDEDGETISGSKKQKVYNYLNSISDEELSQDYKKIICKIEDINTYDNDIVNFVNSSKNLNYSERTEILKDIGFKIDKDGKIQTKSMIPIYKYVK